MSANIEFYLARKSLRSEFVSASGRLNEKQILVLVFKENDHVTFAYELPLSPSMGETVEGFLCKIKSGQVSHYLEIARSYYSEMVVGRKKLPVWPLDVQCLKVATYGIGDRSYSNSHRETVLRLKGSPENFEQLIDLTHTFKNYLIIDFNQSLNEGQFQLFIRWACLDNIKYIEQPLPKEKAVSGQFKVPIWADESMGYYQCIDSVLARGFNGLVLKPHLYDYKKLKEILDRALVLRVPFIIGSVISDSLHASWIVALNRCMSTQVQNIEESLKGDLAPHLTAVKAYTLNNSGEISFNPKSLENLEAQYSLCYSMPLLP